MILKKLSEAKVAKSDNDLVTELRKDSKLNALRDETIINIIRIFKKVEKQEATAENILKWFNDFETFGNFVITFAEDVSTYSISDFAEHEEKLLNAIRALLRKENIINDNDEDLTRKSDADEQLPRKKLTPLEMCSTVFDYWSKTKDRAEDEEDPNKVIGYDENGDAIYQQKDAKQLKDNTKFSREKFLDTIDALEDVYDSLSEAIHVCEKCGHSPCICEEEGQDEPAPEGVTFDLSDGTGEPKEVTIPAEQPSEDVQQNAFSDLINFAIQKEWEIISQINSLIATFDYEYKNDNKDDITAILSQLVDDSTINVGMLHKVAELVSTKTADLLDSGEEKAEEIISEPAQDLE